MKKGIILLLVVLALVVLISPGIIGRIAEDAVSDNMQWPVDETETIVVTPQRFERGWFTSEGQHRVELRGPKMRQLVRDYLGSDDPDAFATLVVETRLDHGLIPIASMAREHGSLLPGLGSAVSTLQIELPDGETLSLPGHVYTNIGLSGTSKSTYSLDPGTLEADAFSADWGAANVEVSVDAVARNIVFDTVVDRLRIDADGNALLLGRTELLADRTPSGFGMPVGELDLRIETLAIEEFGTTLVELGPVDMQGTSRVDGVRISGDGELRMAGIPAEGYGVIDIDVALRYAGFDAASLARIKRALDDASDDASPEDLFALVEADLAQLFAAGFEVNFDRFDFDLPQGAVASTLSATIGESDLAAFNWTSILLDLEAAANLKVAEEFVDFAMATNPEAGVIVGMGYLRKQGDVYEMDAAYAKGLLTINGAPTPIPLPGR